MRSWIALFRGINVGGKNTLPMAALVEELASLKFSNVQTYIQSGNAIFNSAQKNANLLAAKIGEQIEGKHGFRPQLILLTPDELRAAIEGNPFENIVVDPRELHFYFLDAVPKFVNEKGLEQAKTESESYQLAGRVFYLYAPDGVGRSKLAANVERHLGVMATARNYRTVLRLAEMLQS